MKRSIFTHVLVAMCCISLSTLFANRDSAAPTPTQRIYHNQLTRIAKAEPLLADHPEFTQPIQDTVHYEAPVLVDDRDANLQVRAWRFSYNARGVIEIPNRLKASKTAIVVVHPWGIEDGQGWKIPQPAGFAFGIPEEVENINLHMRTILNPFLKSLRGQVATVLYSLPGDADPIRQKIYRTVDHEPTKQERLQGRKELEAKLRGFNYRAGGLPAAFMISTKRPVADYFRQFPGGAFGDPYNGPGFWDLPVPVSKSIDVDPRDVVIFDSQGYEPLRDYLKHEGVEHVLLTGYHASLCYCSTTAGYLNLERDFNVFLVGDATLDIHPGVNTPSYATSTAISRASREHLITQISWIRTLANTSNQKTHQ